MDASGTMELAREDGPTEFRTVTLHWDSNGISVHTYDIGATAKELFGHDDYEFSIDISSAHFQRLLVAMIVEKYGGALRASDSLAEFCKANDIPFNRSSWP